MQYLRQHACHVPQALLREPSPDRTASPSRSPERARESSSPTRGASSHSDRVPQLNMPIHDRYGLRNFAGTTDYARDKSPSRADRFVLLEPEPSAPSTSQRAPSPARPKSAPAPKPTAPRKPSAARQPPPEPYDPPALPPPRGGKFPPPTSATTSRPQSATPTPRRGGTKQVRWLGHTACRNAAFRSRRMQAACAMGCSGVGALLGHGGAAFRLPTRATCSCCGTNVPFKSQLPTFATPADQGAPNKALQRCLLNCACPRCATGGLRNEPALQRARLNRLLQCALHQFVS